MKYQGWTVTKPGSLSAIELIEHELPSLQPGQVTIKVKALGLNFADVFSVLGLYSACPTPPFIFGLEYSGEVIEVKEGDASHDLKVGDRVFGISRFSSFVSLVNADVRYLRRFPDSWSFEQAAAFPVQAITTYYGLKELGNLKSGQTVLVHSAAGGVGILTLQILQKLGATPIGTVSSSEKALFLREHFHLKEEQVIVREKEGGAIFEAQLEEALKRCGASSFDLVFESLGGEFFLPSYNKLGAGGRLIVFGSGSMMPQGDLGWNLQEWVKLGLRYAKRPTLDPMKLMGDNKSVMGFNLIWLYNRLELFSSMFAELAKLELPPPHVGRVFPFQEMREALKFFQSGKSVGKVVVSVEQ